MPSYDFASCLSPIDFELLSKDLLEAELEIRFENFKEGRDQGIDLRHASQSDSKKTIVQCKRYRSDAFSQLKSNLKNKELPKVKKLQPDRYLLTTSVALSPNQSNELKEILSPYIVSTSDVYGRDRLNNLLGNHEEVERRHTKLWIQSTGVLESILNAGIHSVSREELERSFQAAKIYVKNKSFDEALKILKEHRVCIISGIPGIGKTTLARMLMLYFHKNDYELIKIESDISEASNVPYHNKPRFYYYDDFLGQTSLADKLNKNEDQKLLDFMYSVNKSETSVLVLTTREYILKQAKLVYEKLDRAKFNHRTCVIDLSKYSRRIKAQILYNHLHFSDLPKGHRDSFIKQRGYLTIVDHPNYNPRLIEYLTLKEWVGNTPPEYYFRLFREKLNNPVDIWKHAFENQLSTRAQHLLIVLTTLPREVSTNDLKLCFETFHKDECNRYENSIKPNAFNLSLKELDGSFISISRVDEDSVVQFQSPSIRDFMQNLLLTCESLETSIKSSMFFQQIKWFADLLQVDNESRLPLEQLTRFKQSIADIMQKLCHGECLLQSRTAESSNTRYLSQPQIDYTERISDIANFQANTGTHTDPGFFENEIDFLKTMIGKGQFYLDNHNIPSFGKLDRYGHMDTENGKKLVSALKHATLSSLNDIGDYEIIQILHSAIPKIYTAKEVKRVRDAFEDYVYGYEYDIREIGFDDPEEIRTEAELFERVGRFLDVNTDGIVESINDFAIEIEIDNQPDWDSDYEGSSGSNSETTCTDLDLDSMFGTLKN